MDSQPPRQRPFHCPIPCLPLPLLLPPAALAAPAWRLLWQQLAERFAGYLQLHPHRPVARLPQTVTVADLRFAPHRRMAARRGLRTV